MSQYYHNGLIQSSKYSFSSLRILKMPRQRSFSLLVAAIVTFCFASILFFIFSDDGSRSREWLYFRYAVQTQVMPVILDSESGLTNKHKKAAIEESLKGKPYLVDFTNTESGSIVTFSFSKGSEYSCNRVAGTWMNELNKSIGGKMKVVVSGKVFDVGDRFGDNLYGSRGDVCAQKSLGSYSMPDSFEITVFVGN